MLMMIMVDVFWSLMMMMMVMMMMIGISVLARIVSDVCVSKNTANFRSIDQNLRVLDI